MIITPIFRRAALMLGIVDLPTQRKIHRKAIPKAGGICIFLGIFIALGLGSLIYKTHLGPDFNIIFLGAALTLLLGLTDDIFVLQPPVKLLGQITIAVLVVSLGVQIDFIKNPFTLNVIYLHGWAKLVSILWIITLMNTINMIDGLDGLAAGISAISAFSLFIISLVLNQPTAALILLTTAGASLGFLKYNFNPASIFMGDTGSLLLGYLLAVASIESVLKSSIVISLALPILSLLIPLLDTSLAVIRRAKKHRHIFKADAEHLHHRLINIGFSHKQAVLVMYSATIILNIMAIVFSLTNGVISVILLGLIIVIIYQAFKKLKPYLN